MRGRLVSTERVNSRTVNKFKDHSKTSLWPPVTVTLYNKVFKIIAQEITKSVKVKDKRCSNCGGMLMARNAINKSIFNQIRLLRVSYQKCQANHNIPRKKLRRKTFRMRMTCYWSISKLFSRTKNSDNKYKRCAMMSLEQVSRVKMRQFKCLVKEYWTRLILIWRQRDIKLKLIHKFKWASFWVIEIFIEDKLWLLRIIIRTLLNSQNGNHVLKPVRVEQEKK